MTAPEPAWPEDGETPIYDRLADEFANASVTSSHAVLDSEDQQERVRQ